MDGKAQYSANVVTESLSGYVIDGLVTLTIVQSSSGTTLYTLADSTATTSTTGLASAGLVSTAHSSSNLAQIIRPANNGNSYPCPIAGVYVYNTALSQEDIFTVSKAAHAASVPEPATETLSLPALTGLAARRRRK